MQRHINIACFMLLIATPCVAVTDEHVPTPLRYVSADQATPLAQVIDTRALANCQKRTIAGAHCLPASDLVGPDGQLPSFVDIFWALGSAGISPHRPVLIVGNQSRARDFVAGLLYLCGQSSVQILKTPVELVLHQKHWPAAQGQTRGILRHTVYDANMRDKLIVLPTELIHLLATDNSLITIDGRNESAQNADEYRTGHIPGAIRLVSTQARPISRYLPRPATDKHGTRLPLTAPAGPARFVTYANNAVDSIAYFTRVRASEPNPQVDIRVLPAGWQGWIKYQNFPMTPSGSSPQRQAGHTYLPPINNSIYPVAAILVSATAMLIIFMSLRKRGEKQWS